MRSPISKSFVSRSFLTLAAMLVMTGFVSGAFTLPARADAELLGTKLTPMGADPKASADGIIPAWTGGMTAPPADYVVGQPHIDPYADDAVLFTIDQSNVAEHAARLPAIQQAMIAKYPGKYIMNVYPTRRSCAAPDHVYAATKANVGRARLVDGGNGITGAWGGIAFPIPKNADEVLWNHKTHYHGRRFAARITGGNMYENGSFTRVVRTDKRYSYYYAPQTNSSEDLDNRLFVWMGTWSVPTRMNGSGFSMTNTINQIVEPRPGFLFRPDTRKIARAIPSATSYEAPMMSARGLRIADDMMLFSGSQDRYEWSLVGKRPYYIGYNVYRASDPAMELEDFVQPDFLNPDPIRYELHRVWVIEGRLKPGFKHRYAKRVIYLDEDSWIAVGTDLYNDAGELTHGQIGFVKNYYEHPACIQDFDVLYDIEAGRYNIDNVKIEFGPANLDDSTINERGFGAAALKRAVSR